MQIILADARSCSPWRTYLYVPTISQSEYAFRTGHRVPSADLPRWFMKHYSCGPTAFAFSQVCVSQNLRHTITSADREGAGQSPEFVDTLLRQNPRLLDALLNKAGSSPRDHDEVRVQQSSSSKYNLTLYSMPSSAYSSYHGRFRHPYPCQHQRNPSSTECLRKQEMTQT